LNLEQDFLVAHTRDTDALAELARCRDERARLGRWRRSRREELDRRIAELTRRCIAAGVDWERVPRPPDGLRPPDRSQRPRLGRRNAGSPPPTDPAAPASGPSGVTGTPTETGLDGPSLLRWLQSRPQPVHSRADGSAWLEAPDGSVWYRNAEGRHFALAPDGTAFLPLAEDGFLYTQDTSGTWGTRLTDGTELTLAADGQLVRHSPGGRSSLLGEDGVFYSPAPNGVFYPEAAGGVLLTGAAIGLDGMPIAPGDQLASAPLDELPPPDATDWAAAGDAPLDAGGGEFPADSGADFTVI
jgi:hypothetical protein